MRRRKRHATIIATRFYKKKSSGGVLKQNQKLVILTVLLICGLILGALTNKKAVGTSAAPLREIIENYYQVKGEQSFLQNFLSTLGTESVYMGLALIFGVCAFGEPVLWLLPLIKGLGLGLISGYLYQEHAVTGLAYFSAVILLPSVIASASELFACKESILMTRDINRILLKKQNADGAEMFKLYLMRYAVLYGTILFSAVLSAFLTFAVGSKINLFSTV